MKKIFLVLVLCISARGKLFAQNLKTRDLFDVPVSSSDRMYIVNLGNRNRMQVEFSDAKGLGELLRIDSLLMAFAKDMEPLKDSLKNEINSRFIEYLADGGEGKKVRIRQTKPDADNYMISKGEAALLKSAQDTIVISVISNSREMQQGPAYYRVSFYLNDLNDILEYQGGTLQEKISTLERDPATKWTGMKPTPYELKNDPDISSPAEYGYIRAKTRTFLFRLSVDVQNYKYYFVPSATLSMIIRTNKNGVIREYGVLTETHFFFKKNSSGKTETFANNILSFSYGRGGRDASSKMGVELYPYFSLGYLVKKRGDFFEDNTIKLGVGRFTLFNGITRIEPGFYIDDLYKKISPTLRIVQYF